MKKFIGLLIGGFLVLFVVGSASATQIITNGDFETGDFTGWESNGNVEVRNAKLFASLQGMDNYFALLGKGTSDGTSTLSQDFEISNVGTELTVSFDWAFDYWDNSDSADDTFLSFVSENGQSAKKITLMDLETNGTGFWSSDGGLAYGTYTEVIDISEYVTDEAKILFRLTEEEDSKWWTGTASVVGIDNVSVMNSSSGGLPPQPNPEPATILLFGFGLLGVAGVSRKKIERLKK